MPIDTNHFRLLDNGDQEASLNMAVDEAISRAVEAGRVPSTIRFYTWANPAISIGAFQPLREVDLDRCKENDIRVVRRITGGRALLPPTGTDLQRGLFHPGSPFFPSNLQGCCRVIAEALQLGLQQLGLPVQIVSPRILIVRVGVRTKPTASPALLVCEITVDGRKLISLAAPNAAG